jgi:hypothetical protein
MANLEKIGRFWRWRMQRSATFARAGKKRAPYLVGNKAIESDNWQTPIAKNWWIDVMWRFL